MAKEFHLIARYRDEARRAVDGTTLCEYRGTIAARTLSEAKAQFERIAAGATGFPILAVMKG